MAKSDVDAGNFLVLQNVPDYMRAGGIGADGELANTIAVFIGAGVSAKFLEQLLIVATEIDNSIVAHFDRKWPVMQVAVFRAQIIADSTVDDEDTIRVHRCGEYFAAGKITPLFTTNDSTRLQPFQLW